LTELWLDVVPSPRFQAKVYGGVPPVKEPLRAAAMGASPLDVADAADATSGPAATLTVSGATGTTEPLASVTMSETVNVPGTPYE